MNAWPYLIVIVLLGAMMLLSVRNRRRQAADEATRVGRIGVGTEVMTTSGLYGTVVATNEDGTVQLSVAPGVEVRWAAAALRDAASLADGYRRGLRAGAPGTTPAPAPGAFPPAAAPASPDAVDLGKHPDRGTGS